MKGIYCLLLGLPEGAKIRVGKHGKMEFDKGYYTYVGSAMNSLDARIDRHLRDPKKKYWHIDYLLNNAGSRIHDIFIKYGDKKIEECEFASRLNSNFRAMKNFGSSDCRCEAHLFYCKSYYKLQKAITKGGMTKYLCANWK